MAYTETIICKECKKEATVLCQAGKADPTICESCTQKAIRAKRILYLGNLEKLTIEARIRKIEEWIYDYKPPIDPMSIRF